MLNLFQLNKNQYNNTLVIRQKGESENGCSRNISENLACFVFLKHEHIICWSSIFLANFEVVIANKKVKEETINDLN